MHYSFRTDTPGLNNTVFLLERRSLACSGDLETGFLAGAGPVERHAHAGFGELAARLAAGTKVRTLAIVRNPALVLDGGLPGRIAEALAALAPLAGRWSLAVAGGLTPSGARVSALYSSAQPFIPCHPSPWPLTDAMPDLYLMDAAWLRELAAGGRALPDTAFECVAITLGYLAGRAALYAPALVAGIDGALRARDPIKLMPELQDWLGDRIAGQDVPTLMGPVPIEPRPTPPGAACAPAPREDLAGATIRTIAGLCDPLSLSIVTRTRFARPHLLERLLASVTRARRDGAAIEVVLSTDAPRAAAEAALADLREKFVNLSLRLQVNPAEGHSRVTNLLGGLCAATGDYVAVMDDDDHVDLFAFGEMGRALFLGARPLMVTSSAVHDEEWTRTPSGRHFLTHSADRMRYPAAGWRDMFDGVNRLPVCALVMPRERLLARLGHLSFRHDLSEDYALALLVLTDPDLPEVIEIDGIFGHISVRDAEGHSVTMRDRRPWARDIALYLADLTRSGRVAGAGRWTQLARRPGAGAAADAAAIAALRASLAARERDLRLARREAELLRAELAVAATPQPPAATLSAAKVPARPVAIPPALSGVRAWSRR